MIEDAMTIEKFAYQPFWQAQQEILLSVKRIEHMKIDWQIPGIQNTQCAKSIKYISDKFVTESFVEFPTV